MDLRSVDLSGKELKDVRQMAEHTLGSPSAGQQAKSRGGRCVMAETKGFAGSWSAAAYKEEKLFGVFGAAALQAWLSNRTPHLHLL